MADDLLFGIVALAAVPMWFGLALLAAGALILSVLWWAR